MAEDKKYEHRKYFMNKELYEIARSEAAQSAPFNRLTAEEWLDVIHHVNAHEIEGISPRGNMLRDLETETNRYFLYLTVDTYVHENNDGELVSESESGLFRKAHILRDEIREDYPPAVSSDKNGEIINQIPLERIA